MFTFVDYAVYHFFVETARYERDSHLCCLCIWASSDHARAKEACCVCAQYGALTLAEQSSLTKQFEIILFN